MGIYDRDYERGYDTGSGWQPEGQGGIQLRWPQSVHGRLIVITLIAWLTQLVAGEAVWKFFALHSDWYTRPWLVPGLLTYGFLHSPDSLMHIAGNMYGLWFFGRQIESRYGPREFFLFYFTAILVGGLVWSFAEVMSPGTAVSLGASGAIVALTVLFALNFPHQTILMMLVFPMPAWVLGCFIVGSDVFNVMRFPNVGNVAYMVHLGGAAFALLYYKQRLRLSNWISGGFKMPSFKRRPKLRVVRDEEMQDAGPSKADQRVDELLKKIQDSGQDSLTRAEQRELEKASRRYRNRPR